MNKKGFANIVIVLIAIGIVTVISGAILLIFKDEFFKKSETTEEKKEEEEVKNPFPPKPTVSATGEWHGRYDVTTPVECSTEDGGWEARLTQDDSGIITGSYSADGGYSGEVRGSVSAATATWSVESGRGDVSFTGKIEGNTMSGEFTGVPCPYAEGSPLSKGTFFGGRIV